MSLFNNKVFSIKSACIIFAALGIIEYAIRTQNTYSGIIDTRVGWKHIQGTQEKENVEFMKLFRILFDLHYVNYGLNILGSIISSSLLYGVITEKKHFLNSPSRPCETPKIVTSSRGSAGTPRETPKIITSAGGSVGNLGPAVKHQKSSLPQEGQLGLPLRISNPS